MEPADIERRLSNSALRRREEGDSRSEICSSSQTCSRSTSVQRREPHGRKRVRVPCLRSQRDRSQRAVVDVEVAFLQGER